VRLPLHPVHPTTVNATSEALIAMGVRCHW
jgi:hypothetical protein